MVLGFGFVCVIIGFAFGVLAQKIVTEKKNALLLSTPRPGLKTSAWENGYKSGRQTGRVEMYTDLYEKQMLNDH